MLFSTEAYHFYLEMPSTKCAYKACPVLLRNHEPFPLFLTTLNKPEIQLDSPLSNNDPSQDIIFVISMLTQSRQNSLYDYPSVWKTLC